MFGLMWVLMKPCGCNVSWCCLAGVVTGPGPAPVVAKVPVRIHAAALVTEQTPPARHRPRFPPHPVLASAVQHSTVLQYTAGQSGTVIYVVPAVLVSVWVCYGQDVDGELLQKAGVLGRGIHQALDGEGDRGGAHPLPRVDPTVYEDSRPLPPGRPDPEHLTHPAQSGFESS